MPTVEDRALPDKPALPGGLEQRLKMRQGSGLAQAGFQCFFILNSLA